jgi:Protein of unknown function (DUF2442)
MSADDIEHTGIPLPVISNIEALPNFHLRVTWASGQRAGRVDDVDLSPMINTLKIYRPSRNSPDLFKRAHLIEDGTAVAWDENDLEMSAEAIEQLAQAKMTPQDFVSFLKRNGLTQEAFAQIFDYSRRQVVNFSTVGPIPRIVAWACEGYELKRIMREIGAMRTEYKLPEQPPLPKPSVKAKEAA